MQKYKQKVTVSMFYERTYSRSRVCHPNHTLNYRSVTSLNKDDMILGLLSLYSVMPFVFLNKKCSTTENQKFIRRHHVRSRSPFTCYCLATSNPTFGEDSCYQFPDLFLREQNLQTLMALAENVLFFWELPRKLGTSPCTIRATHQNISSQNWRSRVFEQKGPPSNKKLKKYAARNNSGNLRPRNRVKSYKFPERQTNKKVGYKQKFRLYQAFLKHKTRFLKTMVEYLLNSEG